MPFEISPGLKVAETINQRFARLIREGAAKWPEADIFEYGEPCCAITAAARVLGYPVHEVGGYEGSEPIFAHLAEHGIPEDLSLRVSNAHYACFRARSGGVDCRLAVADRLARGDL
jgi:hypothetical protein